MRSRANSLTAFTARKVFSVFLLAMLAVYRKLFCAQSRPNL
jgi:hypothetical protein